MYDLDTYRDELRGFYLDIYHDLPGDVIESEDELIQKISLKNLTIIDCKYLMNSLIIMKMAMRVNGLLKFY